MKVATPMVNQTLIPIIAEILIDNTQRTQANQEGKEAINFEYKLHEMKMKRRKMSFNKEMTRCSESASPFYG